MTLDPGVAPGPAWHRQKAWFLPDASAACGGGAQPCAWAPARPGQSCWGAQYTYVLQHQAAMDAPYTGRLSLKPQSDTQPTHMIFAYLGSAPLDWGQIYFDTEKFRGPVSAMRPDSADSPTVRWYVRARQPDQDVYIVRMFVRPGRHKSGFGINMEQPLTDEGERRRAGIRCSAGGSGFLLDDGRLDTGARRSWKCTTDRR